MKEIITKEDVKHASFTHGVCDFQIYVRLCLKDLVQTMTDKEYMRRAIHLAKKGIGSVNPNPLVGAVIVKDNRIIGEGYHEKYGELHAERNALANCTENAEGATMYVTLEPCCHYGKTPPCTEAIIENKISKVIIGSNDPNPLVLGGGIKILKEAGIQVTTEFLKEECDEINKVFFHYIKTKTPYVTMKYAMTMDGKIATTTGESKWITGEEARKNVQKDRNKHTGIMVGVNTVLEDNPMLTCRLEGGRNPVRIICDTNLRTPLDSNIVTTAPSIRTIIATASDNNARIQKYVDYNCEIIKAKINEDKVDLKFLMEELGKRNIDSILLEGGGTLNYSALKSHIVNKVQAYLAPKIFGGREAKTPVEGEGINSISDKFSLINSKVQKLGEDFLIESEVEY